VWSAVECLSERARTPSAPQALGSMTLQYQNPDLWGSKTPHMPLTMVDGRQFPGMISVVSQRHVWIMPNR